MPQLCCKNQLKICKNLDTRTQNARHAKESIIGQKILNQICPHFYTKLALKCPKLLPAVDLSFVY